MNTNLNIISRWLCGGVLLSLFAQPVLAERHALLVGVSDYPTKPLSGPVNDVAMMRKVLAEKWSFKTKNIKVLLDEEGTKNNILSAIDDLYRNTKEGDDVFIYLSGHGTSANDRDMRMPLPTTSGAFIPIDIQNAKTVTQLIDKLVIGRRDLQPLLAKLDKGDRHVFVAIDACYSGNTVRGFFSRDKLPNRNMNLGQLLPKGFGDDLAPKTTTDWQKSEEKEFNSYPYKNVFYLSASGEHEPAQDIPPEMIRMYPTIDGKPHGAFTDTLLRVLSQDIDADVNEDGQVTYVELKNIVRNMMRTRGFDHTPQGLPTLAEDKTQLANQPLFGASRRLTRISNNTAQKSTTPPLATTQVASLDTPILPARADVLSIKIDPKLGELSRELTNHPFIRISDENYSLELRKEGSNVLAITRGGSLVSQFGDSTVSTLKPFVENQAWVHRLVNRNISQDFTLDVELFGPGKGSTAVRGEDVGFSVRSSESSYILLVAIDSQGTANVIYPFHESELQAVGKNQTLDMKNISTVTPPFGRDYIQVYAFSSLPDELKSLRGQSFTKDSPLSAKLETLIDNKALRKARADLELITADDSP